MTNTRPTLPAAAPLRHACAASSDGASTGPSPASPGSADGATALRLSTMLSRPLGGRNLGGIESHVLRPIITAMSAGGCVWIGSVSYEMNRWFCTDEVNA